MPAGRNTELNVLFASQSPPVMVTLTSLCNGGRITNYLFSVFPPTHPQLTNRRTDTPSLHLQAPKSRHKTKEGGVFSLPWFYRVGFASPRQEERIGRFFTELIGTTVLVLMFYNAGI